MDGTTQRELWLTTIDHMAAEPAANAAELDLIRGFIRNDITLPFETIPPVVEFPNAPNITEHFDVVRARLEEYRQFGTVREVDPLERY